jgi:hypothetical protein
MVDHGQTREHLEVVDHVVGDQVELAKLARLTANSRRPR